MYTMAENWSADVKKYVPDANEKAIAGIVKYCGIALQKRDSSLVFFTDKEEVARVRNNFLKKKLGLTHSDAELDKAIMLAAHDTLHQSASAAFRIRTQSPRTTSNRNGDPARCRAAARIFRDERTD
jgi:hypothetical protein